MSAFDECGVLIPAATLEDFPSDLSDSDARSLLAAWTVLWHPRLLAACRQVPTWYRADSPPDPVGTRILTVPQPSLSQLPGGYEEKCRRAEECRWITGSDRCEMLAGLELGDDPAPLSAGGRTIGVDDFFAAGFAALQVQVMTRRLRYTSNLDEIHLQNRIVAAAEALLEGQGDVAIDALHDVFDCLAEERDHYFASDPHLIDLTLATGTTVDSLLALDGIAPVGSESSPANVLATPQNVLIDHDVAAAIAQLDPARSETLRGGLAAGTLGWAGGGPAVDACLDLMTFGQAESVLQSSRQAVTEAVGSQPAVYARFAGTTPSDMTSVLVRLGYVGLIPLDFAGGTGFGDEAKVILRAAGAEIESLTAKPIDATSDASFLTLGPRLGESIDSGEIATALLAHWPAQACDSHRDLRRVASWSLALGKFWKLDDYFREGEHPYHHGNGRAASPDAPDYFNRQVEAGRSDPLTTVATGFRQQIAAESQARLRGLTSLVAPPRQADISTGANSTEAENLAGTEALIESFASAVGQVCGEEKGSILVVNPHTIGCRVAVQVEGHVAKSSDHIYRVSADGKSSVATVDAPACGFAVVRSQPGKTPETSLLKRLGIGRASPIAEQNHLMNEFMEVTISSDSGGISAAYSGSARGNRFSMRLVGCRQGGDLKTSMRCQQLRVVASSLSAGSIATRGELLGDEDQPIANFELVYTLNRGSRILEVSGELTPPGSANEFSLGGNPWQDYIAARVAVASESSICRLLLRDKVHRAHGRRVVAPLGLVLDEAERQTLIAGGGLPCHVRVKDRFVDTLLAVKGQSASKLQLHYGFDVTGPVEVAKTLLYPPPQIPISTNAKSADIGWLVHAAPKDLALLHLETRRRTDGRLAAIVRVIQTRPASCNAALRFIHEVDAALVVETLAPTSIDQTLIDQASIDPTSIDQAPDDENAVKEIKVKGDRISLTLVGHEVVDLLVIFCDP
jgi:hypothetical protein